MVLRNWKRTSDGGIIVAGKKYAMLIGSRAQVWHGTAFKTNPGKKALTKKNLMQKKDGKIVSRKKSTTAKRQQHLGKYIDLARKNKGKKFQRMSKGMLSAMKTIKKSRKKRKKRKKSRK
jgi:fructose-1,6-bisphosphatase